MNITIIGASAGIGLATVNRALELGHIVKTLSRRKIEVGENPNLRAIHGSALNEADLKRAIDGADAVLVTLGTGMNTAATTLYSDFAKLLLAIDAKDHIEVPVIIVTGFGAGDSHKYLRYIIRPFFNLILNKVYADKAVMEGMIANSGLKWEIVRPGLLTNRALTEKYRVETELRPKMNIGAISRNDVADYLVKEAENPRNIGKYPALTGK